MGNRQSNAQQNIIDAQIQQLAPFREWTMRLEAVERELACTRKDIIVWCSEASLDVEISKDMTAKALNCTLMRRACELEFEIDELMNVLYSLAEMRESVTNFKQENEAIISDIMAEGASGASDLELLSILDRIITRKLNLLEQLPLRDDIDQ